MEKRFLYKVKGYNFYQEHKFKVLVVAYSFDEAWDIANQLAGPGGWVESVKDTDKEVLIKDPNE